jgi:hypothetical protein
LPSTPAFAQADQGAITGTVLDPQGMAVVNADITVTAVDTGFMTSIKTSSSGYYAVSPLKIGHYSVTCAAPGFKTETRSGLMLNVNDRLGVNFNLTIGQATEKVTVSASDAPLLQTEDSSTGQIVSEKVINDTPLNQRNYVFVAQLAAGVAQTPPAYGRSQVNGDFDANGVGPYQNDFILDGVDNNTSAIDFLNNASYVIKPPPDALAEFKVQTSNYSAELGHGGGAVINASIKSGTNAIHGNLWEYVRNDVLNAMNYKALTMPKYRQNQFGATIGGPFLKNHLFFFGDFEANRIVIGSTLTATVPTTLMKYGNGTTTGPGDFSELLNTSLTGSAQPTTLYQPGSGGATLLTCNGVQNAFCPGQTSTVAKNLLQMFPTPNGPNASKTYNNYVTNVNTTNNTAQWDGRVDWNVSAHDQAFARYSYSNNPFVAKSPLGPILDGGGYGSDGSNRLLSENLAISETHVFSPHLANEIRFSFTYGHFYYGVENSNSNIAPTLGLGGVPYAPGQGGIPSFSISGISPAPGGPCCAPVNERENNAELRDNLTKIVGNHAFKVGFQFEKIRSEYNASTFARGYYTYNGTFTGKPGTSFTGYGVADFLADQQYQDRLSTLVDTLQFRWYGSGYLQDDWKVNPRLTLNLGLRYDHFMPFEEKHDRQANFIATTSGLNGSNLGTGTGQYIVPMGSPVNLSNPAFVAEAAGNNITIVTNGSRTLSSYQELNFAPRVGFAYAVMPKTVMRGAYGIFFGGVENAFGTNLGINYPWSTQAYLYSPSCIVNQHCATNGITLETGVASYIVNGALNLPLVSLGLAAYPAAIKTPYVQSYNLSVQEAFRHDLTATVAYVGTQSRHLQQTNWNINSPWAAAPAGTLMTPYEPFSNFGAITQVAYIGAGQYNSLQATLDKRFSQGLYFTATYTYSHSIDDVLGDLGALNANLIPIGYQKGNSDFDQRHRLSLNGNYQLPVGEGRQFLNHKGIADEIVGGWSLGVMFAVQTGQPFNITPNTVAPAGVSARAHLTGNPYKAGGSPNATNPGIVCPTTVRNATHWYNPCAFSNPLPSSNLAPGQLLTSTAAVLPYTNYGKNQLSGPGFNNLNTSLFKRFTTFEGQYVEFRADIFDTFNTVALGQPSGGVNTASGLISGARVLGANNPSRRFVQLALKYTF